MASRKRPIRCAFHEGKRRCQRTGFGEPPLCRPHALQIIGPEEEENPFQDFVGGILEEADRWISRNRNSIVQNARVAAGNYISAKAAEAQRARAPQTTYAEAPKAAPPPSPPKAAPRATPKPRTVPREASPPSPGEDPRKILGFNANTPLTPEMIRRRRKKLAAVFHPDVESGSSESMRRVNNAVDRLLEECLKATP